MTQTQHTPATCVHQSPCNCFTDLDAELATVKEQLEAESDVQYAQRTEIDQLKNQLAEAVELVADSLKVMDRMTHNEPVVAKALRTSGSPGLLHPYGSEVSTIATKAERARYFLAKVTK